MTQFIDAIPVPDHSRELQRLIPVPESREWNLLFSFLFPKIGNGICHSRSRSQKLGMEFNIPVPIPKSWECYFSFPFPFPKFGNWLSNSCSRSQSQKTISAHPWRALDTLIQPLIHDFKRVLVTIQTQTKSERIHEVLKLNLIWAGSDIFWSL